MYKKLDKATMLRPYACGTSCFPIEISIEVPTEVPGRIVEAHLLIERVDLLHVFSVQFEVTLEIVLDSAFRLALWKHRSSIPLSALE